MIKRNPDTEYIEALKRIASATVKKPCKEANMFFTIMKTGKKYSILDSAPDKEQLISILSRMLRDHKKKDSTFEFKATRVLQEGITMDVIQTSENVEYSIIPYKPVSFKEYM